MRKRMQSLHFRLVLLLGKTNLLMRFYLNTMTKHEGFFIVMRFSIAKGRTYFFWTQQFIGLLGWVSAQTVI